MPLGFQGSAQVVVWIWGGFGVKENSAGTGLTFYMSTLI